MSFGLRILNAAGEIVSDPEGTNPRVYGFCYSQILGQSIVETTRNSPYTELFKAIPGMVDDGTWAVISQGSEGRVTEIASGGFWYRPSIGTVGSGYTPLFITFMILRV